MKTSTKIEKTEYTWEIKETAVKEAALKYEVFLSVPEHKKPDLKVIGFKSNDVLGQVAELKEGLPSGIVDALGRELEISRKELARVAGVAERTLIRKIQDGRLTADQSERMARVARLLGRAIEVLGNKERALRWLKAHRSYFGGRPPLDFADTELGCQEVFNLLGRIEYGVFS
jgi:putative toxin-antitoxin system antitoxin component (TIGR02293 family)